MFKFRSAQSAAEKAQLARFQRKAFIIIGIGLAMLFAEIGIGCALVARWRVPAVSIASAGLSMVMLVPVVLAFRNPTERWPVQALATASILGLACLAALMAKMP